MTTTTFIAMTEAAHPSRELRSMTYSTAKDQVARARVLTEQTVGDHPKRDDALLLVSELATNVIRHSNARGFTVAISETARGELKITVINDGNADTVPYLRTVQPDDSIGGRGMRIVDELSKQWGIIRDRAAGLLAVWFVLEGNPEPNDGRSPPEGHAVSGDRELSDLAGLPQPRLPHATGGDRA